MINRKLLFILLGVFFVASVCGVIFHFTLKDSFSLFDMKLDTAISSDSASIDEGTGVDSVAVESLPLDRDGVTATTDDASTTDVDATVEIEDTDEMGDALWEEAKKQDDTVIEETEESDIDATASDDVSADENTKKTDVDTKGTGEEATDSNVIGKFTVNNTGLVVRSGPKGTYDALDTLPVGTTGDITEVINDYWVKIKFGDSEAYVCSKYADIEMY